MAALVFAEEGLAKCDVLPCFPPSALGGVGVARALPEPRLGAAAHRCPGRGVPGQSCELVLKAGVHVVMADEMLLCLTHTQSDLPAPRADTTKPSALHGVCFLPSDVVFIVPVPQHPSRPGRRGGRELAPVQRPEDLGY